MGRHRDRNGILGVVVVIRKFDSKKRLFFAPKAFLNSVARWILNVGSKTGTIRISNTASPTDEAGPSFDIDAAETAKAIEQALAEKYPKAGDGRLIGPGLRWQAGKLGVNGEWLSNEINKNLGNTTMPESSPATTDNTGASTSSDATSAFQGTFTNWSTNDKKELKLRCYVVVSGGSGTHRLNPIDLHFTKSGMLKSANAVDDKSIIVRA